MRQNEKIKINSVSERVHEILGSLVIAEKAYFLGYSPSSYFLASSLIL